MIVKKRVSHFKVGHLNIMSHFAVNQKIAIFWAPNRHNEKSPFNFSIRSYYPQFRKSTN
jgi:hypothetical protein